MGTFAAPTRPARYVELDSLRGLAALTVVLVHLSEVWIQVGLPPAAIARFVLFPLIIRGEDAVILFFVLSGFVLALPKVDGKPQSYFVFVTRRVFRIYIPYLAALAISVAGACLLRKAIPTHGWFNQSWAQPIDWRLVGQHILFLGTFDTSQFDPPIWSLVYEMRISLVFPLLAAIVLALRNRWSVAIAFLFSFGPFLVYKLHLLSGGSAVGATLQVTSFFILGIYIARERHSIAARFSRLSGRVVFLFGLVSFFLVAFARPLALDLTARHPAERFAIMAQWFTALGAGGLMVVSMNSASVKRAFLWPPIHWLGERSYSLYLSHVIVILYCAHLLYGKVPVSLLLCLAFVLILAASWCFYRWIELPSMQLGRRLSDHLRRPQKNAEA